MHQLHKFISTNSSRIILHIGFWIVYLSIPIFIYNYTIHFSTISILAIAAVNIVYIPFYYTFTYFVLDRFFSLKKSWAFVLYTSTLIILLAYLSRWITCLVLNVESLQENEISFWRELADKSVISVQFIFQILFVTAIPLAMQVLRRYYFLQNEKKNLEKINTHLELSFLKSQINPHFLFNTLNNIYSLALQKSDRAPEMIIKLSDLMRYMLYECNIEKIGLQKELQFMNDYIDLEKLRHGNHVEISFTTRGDVGEKFIPPLLFIPFIENAFKHGVNAQLGKSWVSISFVFDTNKVECTIANSKPSEMNNKLNMDHGIGIENSKKRLQLLYPNSHNLVIIDKEETFKVILTIEKI